MRSVNNSLVTGNTVQAMARQFVLHKIAEAQIADTRREFNHNVCAVILQKLAAGTVQPGQPMQSGQLVINQNTNQQQRQNSPSALDRGLVVTGSAMAGHGAHRLLHDHGYVKAKYTPLGRVFQPFKDIGNSARNLYNTYTDPSKVQLKHDAGKVIKNLSQTSLQRSLGMGEQKLLNDASRHVARIDKGRALMAKRFQNSFLKGGGRLGALGALSLIGGSQLGAWLSGRTPVF
jgi:hypothetical protein